MTDRPERTPAALYARVANDCQGGIGPEDARGGGSRRGCSGPPLGVAASTQVAEG